MIAPGPTLLVLVPDRRGEAAHRPLLRPEDSPFGRAALRLEAEGTPVVVGSRLTGGRAWGARAEPGVWAAVEGVEVAGIHSRLATALWEPSHQDLLAELPPVPLSNPKDFVRLCRDKAASQKALEASGLRMPPLCTKVEDFGHALTRWGGAFLKPRYGWGGAGILFVDEPVTLADALAAAPPEAPAGATGSWVLQRAVAPPPGLGSVALRVLVQKNAQDRWFCCPPVARVDERGPVANHLLGARAEPADRWLDEAAQEALFAEARSAAESLEAQAGVPWVAEVGLDFVLDKGRSPHLIEANGVPRGRLRALSEQLGGAWSEEHTEACARPLRALARWAG